ILTPACDIAQQKAKRILVAEISSLTEDPVHQLKAEFERVIPVEINGGERIAEEDKKRKDEAETLNNADSLVYSTEKILGEMKGKIPDKTIDEIKKQNEELKVLLAAGTRDSAKIKKAVDELNSKMQAAGAELYKNASQKQQPGAQSDGPNETTDGEKVVDADFDVEEDKK
ncbi:MAG: Hsp70 family protein, partial [archaeon]